MAGSGAAHAASYYAASIDLPAAAPPLAGDTRAAVCVVGAGYTGLACALALAEAGIDTVLLEANRVGWGASGRNGGQLLTGYAPGMVALEADLGEPRARRLWQLSLDAVALVRGLVERHAIDCHLRTGGLLAAVRPRHLRWIDREADLLAGRWGYDRLERLDADGVRRHVDTPAYAGGLLDRGCGHLHPLALALGMAGAARAAGVRLHENARVVAIEPGRPARVATADGTVLADHVVLATNGYMDGLVPHLAPFVLAVGTFILATEPLDEATADAVLPTGLCVADLNNLLDYYRLSADRRLLFGGRVSARGHLTDAERRALHGRMVRLFPRLAGLAIDHVWDGRVAATRSRMPHLGRFGDSGWFAQGFNGQGVALAGLAGTAIARAIAGRPGDFDALADVPQRPLPAGGRLRTPLLALAALWLRLQDRF